MQITSEMIFTGINALFLLVMWFSRDKLKNIEEKISKVDKENDEIKNNYIKKFQDVHTKISEADLNNAERFGELKLFMSDTFMKKSECKLNHN